MEKPKSSEIVRPKDFYDLFTSLKIPIAEQDWWIIRWCVIVGLTVLAVSCLYVALALQKISLFQLLLGAVSVPLWVGAYFFFPLAIATVFNQLWNVGVIGDYRGNLSQTITYQDLVLRLARQIHSRRVPITPAVIVIVFWLSQWLSYFSTGVSLVSLPGVSHWIYVAVYSLYALYTLIAYVALLCIIRLLFVAIAINRLFSSFTINVIPLHPDGAGGLGALHQLLLISNIMLVAGLCFTGSLFSRAIDSVFFSVLLFGYLILFPAVLTVWLVVPHQVMLRARNAQLQVIVNQYNQTIQGTRDAIKEPNPAIAEGTERLVTLKKHYDQVKESFPIWPVEISFTSRLVTTLLLPLLTSFIPAIINLITKIIK